MIKISKKKKLRKVINFFKKKGLFLLLEAAKEQPLKVNELKRVKPYRPELIDLYNLYQFIIKNKRITSLEFGCGWSSLVIALALRENKKKYSAQVKNLRRNNAFQNYVVDNEKKYLNEAIDTGWISSESPFVTRFEKAFSEYFQMKFASTVSNGTLALELAVRALGLKKNDEVILPSFTIISCVLAVIRAGAKPVLVDVNPETWNMDVDLVESKINSNTKAILVVHNCYCYISIENENKNCSN
jgi:hypothetical protein